MQRREPKRGAKVVPFKAGKRYTFGCAGLARRSERRKHHRLPGVPNGARDGAAMSKSKAITALVMRARKLGYPARLREPITRLKAPYLGPLSGVKSPATDNVKSEFIAKMEMLSSHYGIRLRLSDADNTEAVQNLLLLTLRLLSDWVPGFQIIQPAKRGRKRRKSKSVQDNEALELFLQVEIRRLESANKKILEACRDFKRRSKDKRRVGTIRNIYMAGRAMYALNKKIAASSLLQSIVSNVWSDEPRKRVRTVSGKKP